MLPSNPFDLQLIRHGTPADTRDLAFNFGSLPDERTVNVLDVLCLLGLPEEPYERVAIVRALVERAPCVLVVEYFDDGKDHHVYGVHSLTALAGQIELLPLVNRSPEVRAWHSRD